MPPLWLCAAAAAAVDNHDSQRVSYVAMIAASSNRCPALTQRLAPSTWLFEIGLRAPNPSSASFRDLVDIPSGSRGKIRISRTTGSLRYARQSPVSTFDSGALARLLLVEPADISGIATAISMAPHSSPLCCCRLEP